MSIAGGSHRSLYVDLVANVSGFTGRMVAAGETVKTFGNELTTMNAKSSAAMAGVARGAGRMGLVGAAGLALVGKAAINWESDWKGVQKTVSGTADQMAKLESQLRDLARNMPASHQEIAATAEAAGQLGVATENIAGFTKIMVEMGASTNLSADEAATSIAQFMNVMGSAPDTVDNLGNTIVALGNKGASTESDIVHMAQRISGAGKLLGASQQDVLGLSAGMANLGIQSELGGGAIQRSMLVLNTAISAGGDGLTKIADLAGTSSEKFAAKWKAAPIRAFDDLIHGLGRAKKSGQDIVPLLGDLGIKGTQNLQVLLRLAGSGDMLTKTLDQSSAAWKANTALYKEFGLRAQTDQSKMQIAWNRITDAAISTGQIILPIVGDIAAAVGYLADQFGSLPGPVQTAFVALLALATLLGGGIWAGAKIVGGLRATRANMATLRGENTLLGRSFTTAGSQVQGFIRDLKILSSSALPGAARSSTRAAATVASARQRMLGRIGTGLKAGAGVAGIALMATGAADSIGLTNTASLGLIGSMAGPYGAALGVAAGATMDFVKSQHAATDASRNWLGILDEGGHNLAAYSAAIKQSQQDLADLANSSGVSGGLVNHVLKGFTPQGLATNLHAITGTMDSSQLGQEEANAQLLQQKAGDLQAAASVLAHAYGIVDFGQSANFDQMQAGLDRATPAMQKLGLTTQDVAAAMADGSIVQLVPKLMSITAHAETTSAKTQTLGKAVSVLGTQAMGTAEAAKGLSDALNALLDPSLTAEQATDAWRVSLQNLTKELKKVPGGTGKTAFSGFSKQAIANRDLTRQYVTDSKARLVALAGVSTTTESQMAHAVASTRREFIAHGIAAGIDRKVIIARANALGLTPKLVRTTFQAVGISKFDLQVRAARAEVAKIPAKKLVAIKQAGFPETRKEAIKLADQLNLTAKERAALISLVDQASAHAKAVGKVLDDVGKKHPKPTITVDASQADGAVAGFLRLLGGIPRSKTTTIQTVYSHAGRPGGNPDLIGGAGHAGGGLVIGPGGSTDDQIPVKLSNREYVQKASAVAYYGTDVMHALNAGQIDKRIFTGKYGDHARSGGSGGSVTVIRQQMPGKIELVLDDGTRLSAYVRGHASDKAQQVYDNNRDYERRQAGG